MFGLTNSIETDMDVTIGWPQDSPESLWKSDSRYRNSQPRPSPEENQADDLDVFVKNAWSNLPTMQEFLDLRVHIRLTGPEATLHSAYNELDELVKRPDLQRKVAFAAGALTSEHVAEVAATSGTTIESFIPGTAAGDQPGHGPHPKQSAIIRGDLLRVCYAERMMQLAVNAFYHRKKTLGLIKENQNGKALSPGTLALREVQLCTKRNDLEGLATAIESARALDVLSPKMFDMHMYLLTQEKHIRKLGAEIVLERLKGIETEMSAANVPWVERNYTMAIRGFVSADETAVAHQLLAEIPTTVQIHWRTLMPLIEGGCQAVVDGPNDPDAARILDQTASIYFDALESYGLGLNSAADAPLFAALTALQHSIHPPKPQVGDKLLQMYRDHGKALDTNCAAAVEFLRTRDGWTTSRAVIDCEGQCAVCKSHLNTVELTDQETSMLLAALEKQVCLKMGKVGTHQKITPQEFMVTAEHEIAKFNAWLSERGPVSFVVDSLNVGFSQETPYKNFDRFGHSFSPLKLAAVFRGKSQDDATIAIGKKHLMHGSSKQEMRAKLVTRLVENRQMYLVPDNFHDDLFTIYAALQNGAQILGNDQFPPPPPPLHVPSLAQPDLTYSRFQRRSWTWTLNSIRHR
jgi:hypothetical protein